MGLRICSYRRSHSSFVEMQNGTIWKTVWQFLINLNILLSHDIAIVLLGIYSIELTTYIHMKVCTRMFIAVLFTIARN